MILYHDVRDVNVIGILFDNVLWHCSLSVWYEFQCFLHTFAEEMQREEVKVDVECSNLNAETGLKSEVKAT